MSKRSVLLQLATHPTRYQIIPAKEVKGLVSRGMAIRKEFDGETTYKITQSGIRKAQILDDREGAIVTVG